MSHKTYTVYSQEIYDVFKNSKPNATVILETDPEKVRIHNLIEPLSIQYELGKENYPNAKLALAAYDIIVPGFYKILSIREAEPRDDTPQDYPKRFIATANWKPTYEEAFIPEFEVEVRLNPLYNKVSKSNIITYAVNKGGYISKTLDAFNIIPHFGLLWVKNISLVDDKRYPIKKEGELILNNGEPIYQQSYSVEWAAIKDPERESTT